MPPRLNTVAMKSGRNFKGKSSSLLNKKLCPKMVMTDRKIGTRRSGGAERGSGQQQQQTRSRRMASLNAQAKMHALYDSDGRSSFEELSAAAVSAASAVKSNKTQRPTTQKKRKNRVTGKVGDSQTVTSPRRMASLNAQAILAASYSTDRPKPGLRVSQAAQLSVSKTSSGKRLLEEVEGEEEPLLKRREAVKPQQQPQQQQPPQYKSRRLEEAMDLEKTLDLAKMVISSDSEVLHKVKSENLRRDKIEDKAEVTISGMYINPVTNTSQSFCFSRVQTYKQATSSTSFSPRPPPAHHPPPPPPPPPPSAHCHFPPQQPQPPTAPPPLQPQPQPHHYPPNPSTGTAATLPLDLALARHYNSAFAVPPHYNTQPNANPANQHYSRHHTGYYQPAESCLIHKPVPFHPFPTSRLSQPPLAQGTPQQRPPQPPAFPPHRHPTNNNNNYQQATKSAEQSQQQRPLLPPTLQLRRTAAASAGTNKQGVYYAGPPRTGEGETQGGCQLCIHFSSSSSSSSSAAATTSSGPPCPSHWKTSRAGVNRARPNASSIIAYGRPPPAKPDVGGLLSTLPTQTKTLTLFPPKKVKMEVDDIFMEVEQVPTLSKRYHSESPPVGNHPMATRRPRVSAEAVITAQASAKGGGGGGGGKGEVKRGVTLTAEEFFKKVTSSANWLSSAQRQKEMEALRRAFNPTVTVPCLPLAAQLKKIANSNRGNMVNGMKGYSNHPTTTLLNRSRPSSSTNNRNTSHRAISSNGQSSVAKPAPAPAPPPSPNTTASTTTSTTSTAASSPLDTHAQPILRNRAIKNVTRYSNGWTWEGAAFQQDIYIKNDDPPVRRRCFPAMRHIEGDIIRIRDCVLLKSGPRKNDLPYVAKVAALWENPEDGEMMFSLLWYYRPEHTEFGRKPHHMEDEIFASKHRDVNSVACIEDKCYVLTMNEYCRYRRRGRMMEQGVVPSSCVVAATSGGYVRRDRQPPGRVSADMVFFCRKVYDFRQKRILKNPT